MDTPEKPKPVEDSKPEKEAPVQKKKKKKQKSEPAPLLGVVLPSFLQK